MQKHSAKLTPLILLKLGSLMLDLGNGDEIHIDNFDQNDVFNSSCISGFEFVDGATRWRAHSAIIDRKAANDACLEGERKVA